MQAISNYSRIESIDLLRGIVLILMLLDHTRTFFSNVADPLSLSTSTPGVYFTRWITHFCAPVFIFLAGVSAYLSAHRENQKTTHTSYFLLTRGVWFIGIEWTLLYVVWTFFLVPYEIFFAVFSAIGFSMIFLAFLVFLPLWLIGVISVLLITGHNLLDNISATSFGNEAWLWMILHERGKFGVGEIVDIFVIYPLIPWIGVMGLGYYMGQIFSYPEGRKRLYLLLSGLAFTITFILLRYMNGYGDSNEWAPQTSPILTIMSFLNTQKYPPSLLYLLMTLGPACILLGLLPEKYCRSKFNQIIIMFGKVPFFFYVLHIALALFFALIIVYFTQGFEILSLYYSNFSEYGYNLDIVYLMTFLLLIVLYYPCVWYGKLKSRNKKWYFSYL